jgi:hypothetical protein
MKPLKFAVWYVISFVIVLGIVCATYRPKTEYKCESISTEIQGLKTAITALTDTVNINRDRELLDKIDELTRQDLVKDQIIADQAKQIEKFGWLGKAMDKEGVNP